MASVFHNKTLSMIGVGAFGQFFAPHLAPHVKSVTLFDPLKSADNFNLDAENISIATTLNDACKAGIIMIAVPVQQIETVIQEISPLLKDRESCLVMDVASVKVKPLDAMLQNLPAHINVVGTHPLFGPQSGKNGISGQNIIVVEGRGDQHDDVCKFFLDSLDLKVIQTLAEVHDHEMAYVQGLTHMIAQIFKRMDVPDIKHQTRTYSLLCDMVDIIRNDSFDLFKAIQTENPYAADVRHRFLTAIKELEQKLGG